MDPYPPPARGSVKRKKKFTKSDFAAMNKKVGGVYYPPGKESRPQLMTTWGPRRLKSKAKLEKRSR
jgi:hypothetical protein